jgi:integrase
MRKLDPSKRDGSQRWELRVYVGRDPDRTERDDDGKVIKQGPPVHVSRVFRGGKREAVKALDALVAEVGTDRTIGKSATVGKLLDEWLADLERLGKARSTMETYRAHIEKHIRPGLGSTRLDRLSVTDINHYLADLDKVKKLAPRTIQLDHAVLSAALTHGVDTDWLKSNPAKRAKLKPAKSAARAEFTTEHIGELYQAAIADEDVDMAIMIALAAVTGCRRGELAGLRWNDLDTEKASLRVCRQWVPGKGGQQLQDETKTGNARTVYIGAEGVELVDRYRETKREQTGREPDGWLLSNNGGVTPMRAKSMTEYFGRLAKDLKIPATLHTLRHWKQSEMSRLGVDLPTAADQGGHSIGVMAETYLHTSDDRAAAAGELVAAVVGKAIG